MFTHKHLLVSLEFGGSAKFCASSSFGPGSAPCPACSPCSFLAQAISGCQHAEQNNCEAAGQQQRARLVRKVLAQAPLARSAARRSPGPTGPRVTRRGAKRIDYECYCGADLWKQDGRLQVFLVGDRNLFYGRCRAPLFLYRCWVSLFGTFEVTCSNETNLESPILLPRQSV